MFAPEGTRPILAATFLGLVLAGGGVALGGWGWALVGLGALGAGATLWAFRDPERTPPTGADRLLLAPADGRVVAIATEPEPHYLGGAARRVTILLTPLSVHVGRSPVTGRVELTGPVEGSPPSRLGLRHDAGVPVLVHRTAGPVGGRAVAPTFFAPIGARLSAGQRLGLLPLGARVVVAVPPHVVLDVEVGQRTVAGETVIGRLPSSAGGDGVGRRSAAPILEVV